MSLEPVSVAVALRTTDGDELELRTRRFELIERIDHPYEATVELVSDNLDLDVRSLLGARARLELDRPGVTARALSGVVTHSEYVTTRNKQLMVRLVVEPSLALLRYSVRRRIFADLTLPEVLEAVAGPVFETHGGAWDASKLSAPLGPRDYRVQWGESDLDFVLRLLSESGLCLLHGQQEDEPLYVLSDINAALPGVGADPVQPGSSEPPIFPFEPDAEEQANEPSVQYLGRRDGVHAQGVRVAARDWKTPGATRYETRIKLGDDRGRAGHVWSYHPGRLDEGKGSEGPHDNETDAWATRLLEEQRASGIEVTGASNIADLLAGSTFELQGHPHVDLDQRYAVVSVVHQADFPEVDLGAHGQGQVHAPTYTNRFVAAPLDAGPVRPPLLSKPRATGIESATVVGPEGEDVHTDTLGRVQVRFHWDEAPSQTCWLRVMSPWAGPGYGASFIPRVGMEVVVGFLGGDPDRPVVTGCLYTGTNMPPGALPESKTCTTLRTQSSPGGEGFNELRFEDAAGSEEVFLHAQRNQRTVVRSAQTTSVGASRSLSVGRDSNRTIGGTETVRIGGKGEKPGDLDVHVSGNERRVLDKDHEFEAENARWQLRETLKADATNEVRVSCAPGGTVLTMSPKAVCIEAPESIKLRVGSAELELTPRGVFISGPVVTATVKEQLLLTSDAGNLALTQEQAGLYGGTGRESKLELRGESARFETAGGMFTAAESMTTKALALSKHVAVDLQLFATNKMVVDSSGSMDVHAPDGLVDVIGARINLNS